ncbi:MAG: hypothetical protein U0791_05750 [Gemmataceae bacterium]
MSSPHLQGWIAASVPKAGSRAEENEDASAGHGDRMRFAIADGASESWQSGGWAKHLAQAYLARPPGPADFDGWLKVVREKWAPPQAESQSWYAEVKSEQGSFATILGLEFRVATDPPGLVWKSMAVGDSCLFLFRGGKLDLSFPMTSEDGFGNRPPLVPSSGEQECPEPEWLAGWAESGDLLLLATDAVSRLLLKAGSSVGTHPLVKAAERAVTEATPGPLLELLNTLRPRLRDDATVLAVKIAETKARSANKD